MTIISIFIEAFIVILTIIFDNNCIFAKYKNKDHSSLVSKGTYNMQRIEWIDFCRGLFMMMILWFHTEYYYIGHLVIPYSLYVENSLIGFFFISGYLFFPYRNNIYIRKGIYNTLRKLLIPYLCIVPIIYFIKTSLQHDFSFSNMFISVLTGKASWFVSSLILCHLYIVMVCSIRKLWVTITACSLPFLIIMSFVNSNAEIDVTSIANVSAITIFFMLCGHIYRRFEKHINNIPKITYVVLGAVLFVLKYIEIGNDIKMTLYTINIDNYLLLILDTLIWCFIIIGCCKMAHGILGTLPCRYIKWIGKHSLVFYFICGGVPRISSFIMHGITDIHYYFMPFTFMVVMLLSTSITWILYHCKPFRKYILGIVDKYVQNNVDK